ncbi:MAG TPA: hypothetical protein VKA10_04780 [Prolixibacteraceae bacterium]|nr:hypothetical protein [Prolixibacteraceae bacterium]
MLSVNSYINHFLTIWEASEKTFPKFDKTYSGKEQEERELQYGRFQKKLQSLQSAQNIRELKTKDPGNSFFPLFRSFLKDVFDFDPAHLEIILSDEFKNVSRDFYYQARAFGPELTPENIYQAIRNVWIMNGLQLMMDVPVEITPSIFGYSMIYPYSDNLLDDPMISSVEKEAFSQRFNQRLHGTRVSPQNHTESQLFKLVGMIESQFSREKYPEVFESLYAIQQGQTKGLRLCGPHAIPKNEIRHICFEKGGASVLADGYLVTGKLTPAQGQALFGYGVYLQLLDDIQDVKEDAGAQTRTMFSHPDKKSLDGYVNQTIHFGRTAMEELRSLNPDTTDRFLSLMNRSIETMIIESVGLNHNYFSTMGLNRLEVHSPLRFEFLRQKKSQSKSQRFALFQKYFNQPYTETQAV